MTATVRSSPGPETDRGRKGTDPALGPGRSRRSDLEQAAAKAQLVESLNIEQAAREHALSGDSIMNVIRYASLQALQGGSRVIAVEDVLQGIRREYAKEGKQG